MSRLTRRALAAFLLAAFVITPALFLSAADAKDDDEAGFTPLFNGKDLTGWVYAGKQSGKGYQVNEEGVLYCTKQDGGNLFTEKEYADFAYRFEFKLEPNANNGIGIRSPLTGDPAYVAMEIQVLDDDGSAYTKLRPTQYHGSIYDVVATKRGHQKPVGEWNEQEIRVKGRQVTVTLNGTVITDVNLADIKDEAILKKHPGLQNTKGHIGFLGHGARVEFRKMRIKEL